MGPKFLPPELLYETILFLNFDDVVPNVFPSCRMLYDFLLPRAIKWAEELEQRIRLQMDFVKELNARAEKITELEHQIREKDQKMEQMEQKMEQMEQKMEQMSKKMEQMEEALKKKDEKLEQMEEALKKKDEQIEQVEQKMEQMEEAMKKKDEQIEQLTNVSNVRSLISTTGPSNPSTCGSVGARTLFQRIHRQVGTTAGKIASMGIEVSQRELFYENKKIGPLDTFALLPRRHVEFPFSADSFSSLPTMAYYKIEDHIPSTTKSIRFQILLMLGNKFLPSLDYNNVILRNNLNNRSKWTNDYFGVDTFNANYEFKETEYVLLEVGFFRTFDDPATFGQLRCNLKHLMDYLVIYMDTMFPQPFDN